MGHYFVEVLAAGSQFLNALTAGNRDQTFSARNYEAISTGRFWWYPVYLSINSAYWLGQLATQRPFLNHCEDAFMNGDDERTYSDDLKLDLLDYTKAGIGLAALAALIWWMVR